MRRLVNVMVLAMVAFGIYQVWPLIAIHFFVFGERAPAEILVCELNKESDGYRMHLVYEYTIEKDDAKYGILGSQMSDIMGNVREPLLLNDNEAEAFLPLLEDSDRIQEFLPEPIVYIDPNSPMNSGRLYLAFDQHQFRYGMLCIALPILVWLCSLLIRSFVMFQQPSPADQHEPQGDEGVKPS